MTNLTVQATVRATMQTRYSFTAQQIVGSVLFSQSASALETNQELSLQESAQHRAFVISAVMQAVAAVEAELSDALMYGPAHFLGGSEGNSANVALLAPHIADISHQSGIMQRWKNVAKVLGRSFHLGAPTSQQMSLLVGLRNELTHHKSIWGGTLDRAGVLEALMAKGFKLPPWVSPTGLCNDFPSRVLVAACGHWAANTAAAFLDHASDALGSPKSVLDHYRGGDFKDFLPPRV